MTSGGDPAPEGGTGSMDDEQNRDERKVVGADGLEPPTYAV
jgi:hypothetical protein